MKISLVCCAVFITVVSASYQPRPLPFKYGPTHRGVYSGAASHGGGIDPLTLLLLQKNGGGNGGINRLLPILLTGGGLSGKDGHVNPLLFSLLGNRDVGSGLKNLLPLFLSGGLGGKKGDFSPLLLTSSLLGGKCVEEHPSGCTQPTTANANPLRLCGNDPRTGCSGGKCCPCCTCPDTVETGCQDPAKTECEKQNTLPRADYAACLDDFTNCDTDHKITQGSQKCWLEPTYTLAGECGLIGRLQIGAANVGLFCEGYDRVKNLAGILCGKDGKPISSNIPTSILTSSTLECDPN